MAEPNASSNAATINKAIDDAILAIIVEEEHAKAMIAEHVQPHREEVKAIKLRLKEKHEIDFANIKGRYYDLKRERQVKAFEDQDERDRALDQMRIGFEATAKGQNLDWLYALGIDSPKGAAKPKRETVFKGPAPTPAAPPAELDDLADQDPRTSPLLTPHRGMGEAFHNNGQGVDANPHDGGTPENLAWTVGWYRAEGALAYTKGEAITACRYSVGSEAWKDWNHGWSRAAKKDGADAGTVGAAAAVKGAAGSDMPDIPANLRRSRKPTTSDIGTA